MAEPIGSLPLDEQLAKFQADIDALDEKRAKISQRILEAYAGQEGAEVVRDDEGQITLVRNPPAEPKGEEVRVEVDPATGQPKPSTGVFGKRRLHKGQVPYYAETQMVLNPFSTTRRVLGFITEEEHADPAGGTCPRNTVAALTRELSDDPFTRSGTEDGRFTEQGVRTHLDKLVQLDLVRHSAGRYQVTDAGRVELTH